MDENRPLRRQLPRWSQVRDLVSFQPVRVRPTERRLGRALTIADLRRAARRRTPRPVFDYVDGGAEQEIALRESRRQFAQVRFNPRVLRDVGGVDPTTSILGAPAALPLALAPTGFTRMMHYRGERAVAAAAAAAGIPYTLSTMGTTTVEEVAAAAPRGRNWFQLYLWKDTAASKELVRRAEAAGCDTLMLTVDTPVSGARLRDLRNGFTIPPRLTPSTFAQLAMYPEWWFNLLTTGPVEFALFRSEGRSPAQLAHSMFDHSVTFDDVAWLRRAWPGKLVIKGIQTVEDARAAVDAGADGILLSNHGGRQLDRAASPLSVLPAVREAVGERTEILLDGGILTGADIVAAVASGATACLVGRAYLYGLMAGGQAGVAAAIEVLRSDIVRTMQLLGVSRIDELTPEHVTLPASG